MCDLSRLIVKLIHKKRAAWRRGKRIGDFFNYRTARNIVWSTIRKFHTGCARAMLCKENKSQFFKYVKNRLGCFRLHPVLLSGDSELSDSDAVEAFSDEFSNNFASLQGSPMTASHEVGGGVPSVADGKQMQFNCTSADIMVALAYCTNSAAGPDGVSFRLIKEISAEIFSPLTSLPAVAFSRKVSHYVEVRKCGATLQSKGDRSKPSAYRPISLCLCLSKFLEKVILKQFTTHINSVKPLSSFQFSFRVGRSTVDNLFACDAAIAKYLDNGESNDILSFDYMRAFDKVPHHILLESLHALNLHPTALSWFASFSQGRRQLVILGEVTSSPRDVASGVLQGTVISSTCFCVFIDPLLQVIVNLLGPDCFAFTDDFKFFSGIYPTQQMKSQAVVDFIGVWFAMHHMPLSLDSGVIHCSKNNINLSYVLNGHTQPTIDQFKDLGIPHTINTSYSDHIAHIVASSSRLSGALLHVFKCRELALLWSAFQAYVKPILMYASPVWSPILRRDILALEKVQRRYTKKLAGLRDMPYDQRFRTLCAQILERSRLIADVSLIHRCIHGQVDFHLEHIGAMSSKNNERSGKLRLEQHSHANLITNGLFVY